MKNVFVKLSSVFLGGVLFVGQLAANAACILEFYQPKVPTALKR